ncbi:GL19763 [Drosophila persimilis]|uniref:GL19763 n=1 Tax=Drosophila persimilis TaxID=7234 RepID=B4GYP6_DROPE|nr:GL19763 [Drosophila persimilis]
MAGDIWKALCDCDWLQRGGSAAITRRLAAAAGDCPVGIHIGIDIHIHIHIVIAIAIDGIDDEAKTLSGSLSVPVSVAVFVQGAHNYQPHQPQTTRL